MEKILADQTLRFSSLADFNDPYEYNKKPPGVQLKDGGEDINKILDRTRTEYESIYHPLCNIICFTQFLKIPSTNSLFSAPFAKPRQWAQYGEAQNGICLGFSKEALLENIKRKFPDFTLFKGQVEYTLDFKPYSEKYTVSINQSLSIADNIMAHFNSYKDDCFFRKYHDFKEENEYRIVLIDTSRQESGYVYCPTDDALKHIIMGDRFNEVYYPTMKNLAQKNGATLGKLSYDHSPSLERIT